MQQQRQQSTGRRRAIISAAAFAAAGSIVTFVAQQARAGVTYTRTTTSSGNWSTTSSWSPAGFPNAAGDTADISTKDISGTVTITVDQPVTVGTIKIGDNNNTNGYVVSGGQITFDNGSNSASLNHTSQGNNDSISSAIVLNSDLTVTNSSNNAITISGSQSAGVAGLYTLLVQTGALTDTGAIKDGAGQVAVTVSAANKTSVFSGANAYSGATTINGGAAMRVTSGSLSTASNLVLNGGVLEGSGAFTFTRSLGTGAGQVQMSNGGGFAANGGKLTVNLNNGSGTLAWGSTANFVGNGKTLQFGSTTSNNEVSLSNGIDLNGATRTINVTAAASANDFATLNGVIVDNSVAGGGGTNGIVKTGNGTLNLTKDNLFTGAITVNGGAVRVGNANGIQTQNVVLNGGVIEGSAARPYHDFALGTGPGNLWFAGSGGFAANGAAFDVSLNGGGGVAWGYDQGFLADNQTLIFGSTTANNETIFENQIDLNGKNRTVTVNAAIGSTGKDFATLMGGVYASTGSLVKAGNGILNLADRINYMDSLIINAGTVRYTADQALATNSSTGLASPVVFGGNGALQWGSPTATLDPTRVINVGSNTGSFDTNGSNYASFSNQVIGSGTFQKTGGGTMTFTSTNSTVTSVMGAGGTLIYATTTGVANTVGAAGGTTIIPAGGPVTLTNVNVGHNVPGTTSTFTVTSGAQVTIGTGSGSSLNVATRNNGVNSSLGDNALFDASANSLLKVNVGSLRIATDYSATAVNGALNGTMRGAVNMVVNASSGVLIGESPVEGGGNGALIIGSGTTTISTPTMIVGGKKLNGTLTINPGGTLTITGTASGAVTNLNIGLNNANTGTVPTSTFDTTGGTLIANLGRVVVGEKSTGGAGNSTGNFTLGSSANNLVNINQLVIANFPSGGGATAVGTVTLGGGQVNLLGDITGGGGNSTLKLTGATLDMHGHSIGTSATSAPTSMVFTAGTLRDAADVWRPLAQSGAGTLLDVATTDTNIHGAYTLSGGSAMVAAGHTLTASSIQLSNGAAIGGEGNVVGPVTVGMVGGTGGTEIKPGATDGDVGQIAINGDLSLLNNATYMADLNGGQSDSLNVSGTLDLSSADKLNLAAASGAFDGTSIYTIATFGNLVGQFDSVTGLDPNYEVVYTPNAIEVAPVGVPEPVALSAVALVGGGLMARRRRRK